MNVMYIAAALPSILIALALHEYGHAAMATKMGDPTPRSQGRLTLNPIAHLDPMGTIMILFTVFTGFGFGWGKPVQTNPSYFYDLKLGRILTAIAGPAMNLVQAMLAIAIMNILFKANVELPMFIHMLAYVYITINIVLMLFNMIPIPPLDGGHVLEMMLPWDKRAQFQKIAPFGILIVLALVWMTPFFRWIVGGFMQGMTNLLALGFGREFTVYLGFRPW